MSQRVFTALRAETRDQPIDDVGILRMNADGKAWMYVPAGTCGKIVGGSLNPKA